MPATETWITIGGLLHFSVLIASALVPQVLKWRDELRKLPALFAQLVWVHGAYIVLTIIGLGVVSVVNAEELASGTRLARSFCAFVSLFWGIRLALQFGYFEPAEFLQSRTLRWGYRALTTVFLLLTLIYAYGALAL